MCRGGSNITDADGALLSELWAEEGVIVADICPTKALDMRTENPRYRGQRPDLYYCEQRVPLDLAPPAAPQGK